jgi:hypothetical protein
MVAVDMADPWILRVISIILTVFLLSFEKNWGTPSQFLPFLGQKNPPIWRIYLGGSFIHLALLRAFPPIFPVLTREDPAGKRGFPRQNQESLGESRYRMSGMGARKPISDLDRFSRAREGISTQET